MGLAGRLTAWARRSMPTREGMARNRFVKPFAHRILHPALWRFTRRSVPRGVALGIATGILIPLGQIPASAALALPLRANVPAAALTTFITNPVTTPPLWIAAYWVGRRVLRLDATIPGHPIASHVVAPQGWMHWLYSEAGPATAAGLLTIAAVSTLFGFIVSSIGWRWWVGRKWQKRRRFRV